MSKSTKVILCLVLVAALATMTVLFLRYRSGSQTLSALNAQLAESRNTWETLAAEKEALQKELKSVTNDLKEAQLSLQEATDRATELRSQIETLQQEIAQLEENAD